MTQPFAVPPVSFLTFLPGAHPTSAAVNAGMSLTPSHHVPDSWPLHQHYCSLGRPSLDYSELQLLKCFLLRETFPLDVK